MKTWHTAHGRFKAIVSRKPGTRHTDILGRLCHVRLATWHTDDLGQLGPVSLAHGTQMF